LLWMPVLLWSLLHWGDSSMPSFIKYRISHDSSIGNALCGLYSEFGSLESSVKAFRETGEKDVISWTMILSACGDNGRAGIKTFHWNASWECRTDAN
jgi:hypothetical protein